MANMSTQKENANTKKFNSALFVNDVNLSLQIKELSEENKNLKMQLCHLHNLLSQKQEDPENHLTVEICAELKNRGSEIETALETIAGRVNDVVDHMNMLRDQYTNMEKNLPIFQDQFKDLITSCTENVESIIEAGQYEKLYHEENQKIQDQTKKDKNDFFESMIQAQKEEMGKLLQAIEMNLTEKENAKKLHDELEDLKNRFGLEQTKYHSENKQLINKNDELLNMLKNFERAKSDQEEQFQSICSEMEERLMREVTEKETLSAKVVTLEKRIKNLLDELHKTQMSQIMQSKRISKKKPYQYCKEENVHYHEMQSTSSSFQSLSFSYKPETQNFNSNLQDGKYCNENKKKLQFSQNRNMRNIVIKQKSSSSSVAENSDLLSDLGPSSDEMDDK